MGRSVRVSVSFYNLVSSPKYNRFSTPSPCGFLNTRLESASLRGVYALLDSSHPPLSCLLPSDLPNGLIFKVYFLEFGSAGIRMGGYFYFWLISPPLHNML